MAATEMLECMNSATFGSYGYNYKQLNRSNPRAYDSPEMVVKQKPWKKKWQVNFTVESVFESTLEFVPKAEINIYSFKEEDL
jgi:hypothetical protein